MIQEIMRQKEYIVIAVYNIQERYGNHNIHQSFLNIEDP